MEIYIHRNGQKMGPYSPEDVRASLAAGSVQASDLAWHEGATNWAPLSSIPEMVNSGIAVIPKQIIPPLAAPKTSGAAITSLVLGIASFFTTGITAIPAIVFGHIAISQIKKDPARLSGDGLAIAGLVTGYIGALYLLAMIVLMVVMVSVVGSTMPSFLKSFSHDNEAQTECLSHAKQIADACKKYAKDHQGNYPPSLETLVPDYVKDRSILTCPMTINYTSIGYQYFPGRDHESPSRQLIISKGETHTHQKVYATYSGETGIKSD